MRRIKKSKFNGNRLPISALAESSSWKRFAVACVCYFRLKWWHNSYWNRITKIRFMSSRSIKAIKLSWGCATFKTNRAGPFAANLSPRQTRFRRQQETKFHRYHNQHKKCLLDISLPKLQTFSALSASCMPKLAVEAFSPEITNTAHVNSQTNNFRQHIPPVWCHRARTFLCLACHFANTLCNDRL